MKTTSTDWDTFVFNVSGGDRRALELHPDIAEEERRVARNYASILLGLFIVNFLCTGLSAFDVFIDLQPRLTTPVYVSVVVVPVAFFWSIVVFCVLRFLIQIGHDVDDSLRAQIVRLLTLLPVWCLLPLLGLTAAAPIQVRALADDIKMMSVLLHGERLSSNLLEIQLAKAKSSVPNSHECLGPLMTSDVMIDSSHSLIRLEECRQLVQKDGQDPARQAHSVLLLDTIRDEIHSGGLVARVALAYIAAPGTSWLLALVMMSLFSFPVLTMVLARKRAFEYWEADRGRRDLMIKAGIQLHAHAAFDATAQPVPLNRYRSVEAAQKSNQLDFEVRAQEIRARMKRQRDELLGRI
jgi:hypothetical protein